MRITAATEIHKTSEEIFQFTQDYTQRLSWDPFLKSAKILGGFMNPSVGVRTNCISKFGLGMITEYVSFKPPKVAAVKMITGPFFLKLLLHPGILKILSQGDH